MARVVVLTHQGLLHAIKREQHSPSKALPACIQALTVVVKGTPYKRIEGSLLLEVVKASILCPAPDRSMAHLGFQK